MGLWNFISARIWGEPTEDGRVLDAKEAHRILDQLQADAPGVSVVQEDKDEANPTLHHKTGEITYAFSDRYTIDNSYSFRTSINEYTVGQKVSYTIHLNENMWKVSNVKVVENDWNTEASSASAWETKSLVTKVESRDGRQMTVTHANLQIDLNVTAAEFVPIVGDWLDIEVRAEIDEQVLDLFGTILEVVKVRPLRLKVVQGRVSQWSDAQAHGTIDKDICFRTNEVLGGYLPHVGDEVTAEVIESDQGRCVWRALQVVPSGKTKLLAASNDAKQSFEFVETTDGIAITRDCLIKAPRLNERQRFAFELTNETDATIRLLDVKFAYNNFQCSLITAAPPLDVHAQETVKVEGVCTSKNVGRSKELVLFVFEGCTIGRWIHVEVTGAKVVKSRYTHRTHHDYPESRLWTDDQERDTIRGPRPLPPSRFISVKTGDYPVPQRLLQLVAKHRSTPNSTELEQQLLQTKPVLRTDLTLHTYLDRFHTLLHLEEIHVRMEMTKYDQAQASLIRNGEFLMLEIANLAEQRPSLILGDRIVVRDSYNRNGAELEGFIYKMSANHVYLKFAEVWQNNYNGEDVTVRAVASRTMPRRLHQAVALAMSNLGEAILFPAQIRVKAAQVAFTYDAYENVDVMKKRREKMEDAAAASGGDERKSSRILKKIQSLKGTTESHLLLHPLTEREREKLTLQNKRSIDADERVETRGLKLEWYDQSLNYYQKEAVRNILLGEARPLPYLIFGPPGTGKTITIVETILQLLRLIPHSRILVATPSNSAADLLALRLIDSRVLKSGDMIRLTSLNYLNQERLPRKLIPYSASADMAQTGTRASSLAVTQNGLTLGCNSTIVGRHRVTVSTCGNASVLYAMGFNRGHFTHIIIDEAGQCMEPLANIALTFLDVTAGQAILAGDPMQLGPVVTCKMAERLGLQESYLERMLNRFPYVRDPIGFPDTGGYDPRLVTKLVYNYRSLPEILALPNSLFYNSELKPTIGMVDSDEGELLQRLREMLPRREVGPPALVFHGVVGEDSQSEDCPSWFNPDEASQVFFYVHEMYRLGLKATDIGIITPYTKQVQQIKSVFVEAEFDLPKIGTVEEFQGQEYNVIILSTVRSNSEYLANDYKHTLGFVASPRRLNVAITRAQSLMLIIGNPFLLSQDVYWRTVIEYCLSKNSYCGCDFV